MCLEVKSINVFTFFWNLDVGIVLKDSACLISKAATPNCRPTIGLHPGLKKINTFVAPKSGKASCVSSYWESVATPMVSITGYIYPHQIHRSFICRCPIQYLPNKNPLGIGRFPPPINLIQSVPVPHRRSYRPLSAAAGFRLLPLGSYLQPGQALRQSAEARIGHSWSLLMSWPVKWGM